MTNQQDMMQQLLGKTVATAWMDPEFKSRLLTNPRAMLAEGGLIPPPHIELHVVENTAKKTYITLPAPWADTSNPAFMQRLQLDPRTVLSEAGITIPDNIEIVFLENTNNKMNIVIPVSPNKEEISIEKI